MTAANPLRVSPAERPEYVLNDADFHRLRELVREHTGIALSDAKRQLVHGRVVRRLRALGLPGFSEYVRLIESGESEEIEEFVNAVTTNLTSFFREAHHFQYLANEVMPNLARRNDGSRRFRIWSSACSTGEEPYSTAMVLRECQALLAGYDVKILATDLDSNVLATAATGVYPADRLAPLGAVRVGRFFKTCTGSAEGKSQVTQDIRDLITFKSLNLMKAWPMRGHFDVIFCRNVVIYFDKPTQKQLFDRLSALQRPGDILFLGHAESLYRISEKYDLIGRTIYRRNDQ